MLINIKSYMFAQHQYAPMYADVDEEGFDTLLEEHPGVLSNIKHAFSKGCKTKLQEILDESEN